MMYIGAMTVEGIHWYDLKTQDGRTVCGYIPIPNDQRVTYAMSGATCTRCCEEIQLYLDEVKENAGKWPHALPVAALELAETSGVC
jgi:hypothetical protein